MMISIILTYCIQNIIGCDVGLLQQGLLQPPSTHTHASHSQVPLWFEDHQRLIIVVNSTEARKVAPL